MSRFNESVWGRILHIPVLSKVSKIMGISIGTLFMWAFTFTVWPFTIKLRFFFFFLCFRLYGSNGNTQRKRKEKRSSLPLTTPPFVEIKTEDKKRLIRKFSRIIWVGKVPGRKNTLPLFPPPPPGRENVAVRGKEVLTDEHTRRGRGEWRKGLFFQGWRVLGSE